MNNFKFRTLIGLVVVVLGAGAYYAYDAWPSRQPSRIVATEVLPPVLVAPVEVVPELAVEPASAPIAVASAAQAPAILFPVLPIDKVAEGSPVDVLPALADSQPYLSTALNNLLGRQNVLTFLQLDVFARRVVATVDNLARSHAPRLLWPVNPTPGRFTTMPNSFAGEVISPDNSLRYTPLVLFLESVDTTQAVALYVKLYPLFQQAYEEIGYPGRYFNDRFVAVLDHLMRTPVQTEVTAVSLVDVKGPIPSLQPWVRYEFTDPALEALTSGQKMLIRSGPVNHRRLNTKMLELRTLLAGAAVARPD